jgi:hypothetical protein
MQQFLSSLLRFFGWIYVTYLAVVLLLILLFTYLIPPFHSDKGNFSRDYRTAFQNGDAEVLILGSSRAAAAFDTEVLATELKLRTYNLAFNQANLGYSADLLEAYLEDCSQPPEYIILDVSWFSFDNRRLSYKEYAANFIFTHPQVFYADLMLNRNRPLANGFMTILRAAERSNKPDVNFDSNRGRYADQDSSQISYTFSPEDEGFLRTFPGGEAGITSEEQEAFEQLIQLTREYNIQLILFTSPEDEVFSQSQVNRSAVYDYLQIYSQNLNWMDYSLDGNLYDKKLELLLRDSHHIHYKESFSRIFAEDFRQYVFHTALNPI